MPALTLDGSGAALPAQFPTTNRYRSTQRERNRRRRRSCQSRVCCCATSAGVGDNSSNNSNVEGTGGDVLRYWQDLGVAERDRAKLLDLARRRPNIYADVNSLKIKVSEVARLLPPEAAIGHIISEAPKVLSSSAAEIANTIVALNQLLDAVQRFREGHSPSVSVDHLIHWRPGVLCLHPKDVLHIETLVGARAADETDAELAMMVAIWCATEDPDFFLRDPSWAQLDQELENRKGGPRDVSISSLLTMFPPQVWQYMDGYEKQRLLGVLGLGDARFYDW